MKLNNKNIAEVMETIEKFFESVHAPNKDKVKICLLFEEALLQYQKIFGEEQEFQLVTKKWLGTPRVLIKIKGKPFNPLEDDDSSIFSEDIMQNLLNYEKARMIYRYEGGFNEIRAFSPREIKNLKIPGGSNTIAILFAIIFSLLTENFSSGMQNIIVTVITPILNTLIGMIIAVNIPFIFVSVVASICAMENMVTLNTIGTTVLGRKAAGRFRNFARAGRRKKF